MVTLTNYDPTSTWGKMQAAGLQGIQGRYGTMRGQVQSSMVGRGIGRSGLVGKEMGRLTGEEHAATAAMDADISRQKQQYDQAQAQMELQRQGTRYSKKKRRRARAFKVLGGLVGTAGMVAGAV